MQMLYKTTLPGIQIEIAEFCNHLLFLAVLIIFLLAKASDCNSSRTGNDYVYYIINHVKSPKPASFSEIKKGYSTLTLCKKTDDGRIFSIIPIGIPKE